jgi:hypothetical protein
MHYAFSERRWSEAVKKLICQKFLFIFLGNSHGTSSVFQFFHSFSGAPGQRRQDKRHAQPGVA